MMTKLSKLVSSFNKLLAYCKPIDYITKEFPEYSVKQIVLVDDSETNSENYPENLVLAPPFSPSTLSTASQLFTEPDEYFNSGVALCAIQTVFKELHAPIINNNDVSKKRKREETTVAIVKKQET